MATEYITSLNSNGSLELDPRILNSLIGKRIKISVFTEKEDLGSIAGMDIQNSDESLELLKASESSINFWLNDIDDEVWNDA
jgi:hypothetical protein